MPNYQRHQQTSGENPKEESLLPGEHQEQPNFNLPEPYFIDYVSEKDVYPENRPVRENLLDAGYDLRAREKVPVGPGDNALIPTGIGLALPENVEAQVRPRSGLALDHGITVLNSPGTVDAGYRGEIGVILINHGPAYVVDEGERVAQLVFNEVVHPIWNEAERLDDTERSDGAYGSTDENE